MSIEAQITVTLASVEVGDDYRVNLTTHETDMFLTWSEAEQLANELIEAVEQARAMLRDDFPIPGDPAWVEAHHTFDILPICRDCAEGKHLACIGSAFVEVDSEIGVDEVDCGCSKVGHHVLGNVIEP